MDHELNQAIELAAHLHTASELARLQVRRLEQRNAERLKKARQRLNAPTTTRQCQTA